jgi:DNA-binding CsgD family transcriptional regulator
MSRHILLYGLALAALLILLKWLEWRFIIFDHAIQVYSGAIALVFMGLGIWLALKLARPKVRTVLVEKEVAEAGHASKAGGRGRPGGEPDAAEVARLGLSGREVEVLQLMAAGLSNQEIADRLFVSLNTIKTHCSRIFEKMDVRRRTQAVEMAKRLKIIG